MAKNKFNRQGFNMNRNEIGTEDNSVETESEVIADLDLDAPAQEVDVNSTTVAPAPVQEEPTPNEQPSIQASVTGVTVQDRQPEPVHTDFEIALNKIKQNPTSKQASLMAALDRYVKKMAPAVPVSNEDVFKNQLFLYRTFIGVLNNTATVNEFRTLWSIVLLYFYEYRNSVFHPKYIFRGAEYWTAGPEKFQEFNFLCNLAVTTCDHTKQAESTKEISFSKSFIEFSPKARENILGFYNIS